MWPSIKRHVPHPPYSSAIALSHFHMFGKVKKYLQGWKFPTDDIIKVKVQKWLQEQDISSYFQGLENLITCYDKVSEQVLGQCRKIDD
jgi:hypothetical protein